MTVPRGDPKAVEIVKPDITTESAKPTRSGGTMTVAEPTAVGENMAAPRPARALVAKAIPKVGATAVPRFAITKTPRPASSRCLRGTFAAKAAIAGAR